MSPVRTPHALGRVDQIRHDLRETRNKAAHCRCVREGPGEIKVAATERRRSERRPLRPSRYIDDPASLKPRLSATGVSLQKLCLGNASRRHGRGIQQDHANKFVMSQILRGAISCGEERRQENSHSRGQRLGPDGKVRAYVSPSRGMPSWPPRHSYAQI